MEEKDVIDFYSGITNLGITIWLDGGWGVDALIGKQTRLHKDLDITIQQKGVKILRKELEAEGYKETKLDISRPHNFVLRSSLQLYLIDGNCSAKNTAQISFLLADDFLIPDEAA